MRLVPAILLLLALLADLRPARADTTEFPAPLGRASTHLTIASVTDLSAFRPMIEAFQERYPGVAITYAESTSESLDVVSEKACENATYFADLVISSSLPRQIWFVNEGCAEPLERARLSAVPSWARWRNEIVGLTYEPAIIVYNKAGVAPEDVPRNRFDLIDLLRRSNALEGKIGTYDIERSGVGYFLAFEDSEQASTWGRLLESLGRNRAALFCCTGDILDRVADGRLLFGYNLLGSYALERARTDPRIGIVMPSDYTLVTTRTAFVPKTAHEKTAAKLFIDFVLSSEGQEILEKKMNFAAPAGGADRLHARVDGGADSLRPIALTPTLLVPLDREKRRSFIEQWRQSMTPAKGP